MERWRVLIVDDEEDVRTVLRSSLSPGIDVAEAVNGLDALEQLDRVEPDMVVLDVNMPVMNGFACCEAIRRDARYTGLPVMFLTSRAEREDYKQGYAKGADFYMPKPFDAAHFQRNVQIQLQKLGQPRTRKYSLEELKTLESEGAEPESPGSDRFVAPENHYTTIVSKLPSEPSGKLVRSWKERNDSETGSVAQELTPRIMIVDDDPDIISMMKSILSERAEVIWASDGAAAIERLVRWQPDIMIIDINMPRMNGYQLCQSLRINSAFRKLPILVCSANTGERDRERALQTGGTSFLAKPFTGDELIAALEDLTQTPGYAVNPAKTLTHSDILRALEASEHQTRESGIKKRDPYADFVQKMWKSEE